MIFNLKYSFYLKVSVLTLLIRLILCYSDVKFHRYCGCFNKINSYMSVNFRINC